VDIVSDGGHVGTAFEILRVSGGIVANILCCPAAQKRVLSTRTLGCVKVDKAFVNAFFFDKIQGQA
jgi:hypothetical protein